MQDTNKESTCTLYINKLYTSTNQKTKIGGKFEIFLFSVYYLSLESEIVAFLSFKHMCLIIKENNTHVGSPLTNMLKNYAKLSVSFFFFFHR